MQLDCDALSWLSTSIGLPRRCAEVRRN